MGQDCSAGIDGQTLGRLRRLFLNRSRKCVIKRKPPEHQCAPRIALAKFNNFLVDNNVKITIEYGI